MTGGDASARYARHGLIDWFDQQKIASTSAAVIGAGAVGNEVIKNLALLGVGRITIFDFDSIQTHNLTRAVLFRESDVGMTKASVAAARASELDPNIELRAVEGDFWNTLELATLARDYSVVIAAVDNFEARMRASLLSRLAGVNFVSAGIDSRNASVQLHPYARNSACACYECDLGGGVYAAIAKRYSCGWLQRTARDEKKIPTTAITASAAGALAVSLALGPNAANESDARRVLLDTATGRSSTLNLRSAELCPVCAVWPAAVSVEAAPFAQIANRFPSNELVLSDAIITACECQNDSDHTREIGATTRFFAASEFPDSLMWCPVCSDHSVRVDMTDVLDSADARAGSAPNHRIGAKFVMVADETQACGKRIIEVGDRLTTTAR